MPVVTSSHFAATMGTVTAANMVYEAGFDSKVASSGCWIAIPIALSSPDGAKQAYLPPGQYKFELTISCRNADPGKCVLLLRSPKLSEYMDMDKLT